MASPPNEEGQGIITAFQLAHEYLVFTAYPWLKKYATGKILGKGGHEKENSFMSQMERMIIGDATPSMLADAVCDGMKITDADVKSRMEKVFSELMESGAEPSEEALLAEYVRLMNRHFGEPKTEASHEYAGTGFFKPLKKG